MTITTAHPAPRLPVWARCLLAMVLFPVAALASVPLSLVPQIREALTRSDALGTGAIVLLSTVTLVAYLAVASVMTRGIDRRPLRELGLRLDARALGGLTTGIVLSLMVTVTASLVIRGLGAGRPVPDDGALTGGAPWSMVAMIVLARAFLLQGIGEEVLMRGYVLSTLASRPRRAVVASAVLFAVPHLLSRGGQEGLGERVAYLAVPLGFGLAAGMLAISWRSVWAAVGVHGGFHVATALCAVLGIGTTGSLSWLTMGAGFAVVALGLGAALPRRRWREMAAAGPYAPAPAARARRGPGARALIWALVALSAATVTVALIGMMIGPLEAAHGHTVSDIHAPWLWVLGACAATLLAWAILGVAALVLGVRAAVHDDGRSPGVAAIVVTLCAPVVLAAVGMGALTLGAMPFL